MSFVVIDKPVAAARNRGIEKSNLPVADFSVNPYVGCARLHACNFPPRPN